MSEPEAILSAGFLAVWLVRSQNDSDSNCRCWLAAKSSESKYSFEESSEATRILHLWPGSSPTDPQTSRNSKTRKSDSKVIFWVPVKLTQKLLKSGSKVTCRPFLSLMSHFESLLSNVWVTFTGTQKVIFEFLFHVLHFSGFGGLWGYFRVTILHPCQGQIEGFVYSKNLEVSKAVCADGVGAKLFPFLVVTCSFAPVQGGKRWKQRKTKKSEEKGNKMENSSNPVHNQPLPIKTSHIKSNEACSGTKLVYLRDASKVFTYPLFQNYYITAPYFWTIKFGRHSVKMTSQKLCWNYFLAP